MSADLNLHHHVKGLPLGPKLGPYPAAVWVAIVGAGLYIAHRRQQAAAIAPADTTATDTTATTATSSDVPAGASNDVPASDPVSSSDGTSSAVQVTDNLTWQVAAIAALVKNGTTPILANNAIDKYLSGATLTPTEAHAVNVAIGLVGPPPEGAPIVHVKAPPATPPVPRPTRNHPRPPAPTHPKPKPGTPAPRPAPRFAHYTVHAGDTLASIASHHHTTAAALYRKNKAVIEAEAHRHGRASSDNGHWLYAGTVLVMP